MKMEFNKKLKSLLSILCLIAVLLSIFTGCDSENISKATTENIETTVGNQTIENKTEEDITQYSETEKTEEKTTEKETEKVNKPESVGDDNSKAVLSKIPEYSGSPYVVINGNIPSFNKYELTTKGYETYASLDSFGRCGGAVASCGREIMPKPDEERGTISAVKPSGWVQEQYDCVSGKYLYNRCHLIGWQLSAENANKRNLITGTRYMNTEGMLPFENMVADYIKETGNHVAYRITPIYDGSDLVATGVQMEAYSIEDNGEGICFNVFCYNVQPGVKIDYTTGRSWASSNSQTTKKPSVAVVETTKKQIETTKKRVETTKASVSYNTYVYSSKSDKFHYSSCRYAKTIKSENYCEYTGDRQGMINKGYSPCKNCNP